MKISQFVVLICLAACGGTTTPAGKGSVTLTISSAANPSVSGQSVTFTASFTGGSPTGSIDFKDGDASVTGCATQTISAGAAACTVSLTVAAHSITATYAGDANFDSATSAVLAQAVNKAGTSVLLTRSPDTSTVFGQAITFTASAPVTAPGSGTPTGTITILDGSTTLCASSPGSNVATCDGSSLGAGTHAITATYSGDSNFTAAASPVLSQAVAKASSSISQFVFTQPAASGSGSFSVTVTSTAATPAGTVNVLDGSTIVTSCTLAAGASKSANCTTSIVSVPIGSQTFTSTYAGNANLDTSTASTTVTVN